MNRNILYSHDRYGKFITLKLHANEPGFTAYAVPGAATATPNVVPPTPPGTTEPNNAPQNADANQQNNQQDNLPKVIDPFNMKEPTGDTPPANATPQAPAAEPQATRTPQEMLADYTKNLQFQMPEITPEMQTAMSNGDFSALNEHMNAFGRTVYEKMFTDFNQLVNSKVKSAMAESVDQAGANAASAADIAQMHAQLEWTAKPENAPLAEALFNKFKSNGSSAAEAIDLVNKYAIQMAEAVNGKNTPPGASPNGGFNGQGAVQDDTDWIAALGGQPLT